MSKKELEYQKIGDFYLPKVSFPAEDDKIENIGKYGLLRLEYLKEHKKGYYTFLMINGSVPFELRNVDSAANERVKKIIKQLEDEENVNSELMNFHLFLLLHYSRLKFLLLLPLLHLNYYLMF